MTLYLMFSLMLLGLWLSSVSLAICYAISTRQGGARQPWTERDATYRYWG